MVSIVLVVASLLVAAVFDLVTPGVEVALLYAFPVLIAAYRLSPRYVAVTGALAFVVSLFVNFQDHFSSPVWPLRSLALLAVSGAVSYLAFLLSSRRQEVEARNEQLTAANEMLTKAQQALAESEMRYRTVADSTFDWVHWISPEGLMLYCSPSCERVTGYTAQESEAVPDLLMRLIHPDDRSQFTSFMGASARLNGTTRPSETLTAA